MEKQDKQLQVLQAEKSKLLQIVESLKIVSVEGLKEAVNLGQEVKRKMKAFKDLMDFLTKGIKEQIKKIEAPIRDCMKELEQAESTLKNKMDTFRGQEQERIDKERDRLLKEQQKQFEKETKKAEKKGEAPPPPPPPIEIEMPKVEGVQFRADWDFEIMDIKKIPAEYMIPDEKKIRKVVKAGVRDIPGIRIFEKKVVAIGSEKEVTAGDI